MLKEIVGMTKVANCIHATKIMWFQTPSHLSGANQEVHLDSACAAQLGCLQRSDFGYYGLHLRFHELHHVSVDHVR